MTVDLCMLDKNSVDFKLEYFSDSFGSTQINESTGQTESITKVYGDYAFSRWNWNVNEWYSLKLVKFTNVEKPIGTLCNLETGEIWYLNTEANKESAVSSKANYNRFFFHCNLYNDTATFKWGVDNFTLTELGAVSLISATKVEDCVEAIVSVDVSRDPKASGAAATPIIVVEGSGRLIFDETEIDFQKGDSLFVPAQSGEYLLCGRCEVILSTI